MRAVVWEGKGKIEIRNVPDPEIVNPHDAIVKVCLTAICGSDLHLYNHGRRELQYSARRYGGCMGKRTGGLTRHEKRFHVGSRASDRNRPGRLPPSKSRR